MVKVGLIGLGFMGNMHSQCHKAINNSKLVAVADIQADRVKEFAAKYGSKAYTSGDELITDPDVEAVDICLPTYLHKEYVLKTAKAGKHVVCEKPIALNVKEADEMINACAKAKVKFMVAQVLRFWPEYVKLKEIMDSKELGRLTSITCKRLGAIPIGVWDNWMMDMKRSGGATVDLHIHDVDFLYYLLGRPLSLYSAGDNMYMSTVFKCKGGVNAYAEGSWDVPQKYPFTMEFIATFEEGTVEYNWRNEKAFVVYTNDNIEYPKIELIQAEDAGGNISSLGGYYNELKYFIDCVDKNQPLRVVTAKDGRNSLEIVMLELRSAKEGKAINCSVKK